MNGITVIACMPQQRDNRPICQHTHTPSSLHSLPHKSSHISLVFGRSWFSAQTFSPFNEYRGRHDLNIEW